MPLATTVPFFGEGCALAAAICWSIATILFRRSGETIAPLALNLYKNILALLLFAATLLLARCWPSGPVSNADRVLLLVSGGIGIGLSDVLFFMTLNRVGAGLQAIITTSYSPSIIVLSVLFLHERLTLVQGLGIALILAAVGIVAYDRSGHAHVERKTMLSGVIFGLLATATQAVSIVMVKRLLERSPLVWANSWRLIGGVLVSALLFLLLPTKRVDLRPLRSPRNWLALAPGAIMGSYVSLLFWLGGMKFAQASTAAALNQTATLWTFVFAALVLKEPATQSRLWALALGMAGVALVSLR